MTTTPMTRRAFQKQGLRALALGAGLPMTLPATAQQVLQIGRTDFPSPMSDIVEKIVLEALKRTGLAAEVKRFPLSRSIVMANEGATDGEMVRIADAVKNYPNLIAIPTPVAMSDVAIYSTDPKWTQASREDIRKLKVGLTRGTLLLVKHSTGMNVTDTQTISTTFDMLNNQRFDVAMMIHIEAELEIAKQNLTHIVRRPNYWASEPVYFYLNKKHADLVPKINTTMQAMQKEGFIRKAFLDKMKELNITPLKPAD